MMMIVIIVTCTLVQINRQALKKKTFQITKTKMLKKYPTKIQIIIACRGVV